MKKYINPYIKVSILAEFEETKEILKMKAEKLAAFTYSNTIETEKDKKEIWI